MPDYIIEPLDTDPDVIFTRFVEFIQSNFPDWQPSDGQIDVILAKFMSTQIALTADMASRVLRAIFRYFGSSIVGIAPLPGAYALAEIAFTVNDTGAHTVPYNTTIGLVDQNNDTHMFSMLSEVEIPANSIGVSYPGTAVASEIGTYNNNLSGTVFMIEMFDWINTAVVSGASSGGADPEDDDTYLDRLTANLGLMSPRPILAADFAVLARNIPGVWRAAVIDNFQGGANAKQRIASTYTTGTFTLGNLTGGPTGPIPAVATAAQVGSAIAALAAYEPTDIRVTGGPLNLAPIDVEFIGRLGYTAIPTMTATTTGLSGGGATFAISVTSVGSTWNTTGKLRAAISAVDIDGNPLSDTVRNQLIAYLGDMLMQNFVLTWVDPAYYKVSVTAVVVPTIGADFVSVQADTQQSLKDYLSPANDGTVTGDTRAWVPRQTVRYTDLIAVCENVVGVDYVKSLVFGIDGGALSVADKAVTYPFPLSTAGTITVTTAVS